MRPLFTLTAASLLLWTHSALASQVVDVSLGLQVSAGSNMVTFPFMDGVLSWSTGQFTVGDYTISNITEEFVGPGFPTVTDPLQFRLTGINSISCTVCTDPLEIDFLGAALPDTPSGNYLDWPALGATVAMDGSLGAGNAVPTELLLQFADGTIFDGQTTLDPSQSFSMSSAGLLDTGQPAVMGSFFLGCGCTNLAPGQIFSLPDSISVTFTAPEPTTWTLIVAPLAVIIWRSRKRATSATKPTALDYSPRASASERKKRFPTENR